MPTYSRENQNGYDKYSKPFLNKDRNDVILFEDTSPGESWIRSKRGYALSLFEEAAKAGWELLTGEESTPEHVPGKNKYGHSGI